MNSSQFMQSIERKMDYSILVKHRKTKTRTITKVNPFHPRYTKMRVTNLPDRLKSAPMVKKQEKATAGSANVEK